MASLARETEVRCSTTRLPRATFAGVSFVVIFLEMAIYGETRRAV